MTSCLPDARGSLDQSARARRLTHASAALRRRQKYRASVGTQGERFGLQEAGRARGAYEPNSAKVTQPPQRDDRVPLDPSARRKQLRGESKGALKPALSSSRIQRARRTRCDQGSEKRCPGLRIGLGLKCELVCAYVFDDALLIARATERDTHTQWRDPPGLGALSSWGWWERPLCLPHHIP